MAHPRLATVIALVVVLAGSMLIAPTARPTAAQSASDLDISFTPNVTKGKIGEIVEFTARIENTGSGTVMNLSLSLGLPDALNARTVACPTPGGGTVNDCFIGELGPGAVAEAQFYVELGSRDRPPNGPVSLSVIDDGTVIATVQIAPIKIVGSPKAG